ncbi:MAG: hypothetical protein ACRBBP_03365 [Bdellovibrionales bacterium]
MKRLVLFIFISVLSESAFSDCATADMSLLGFTPSVVDFTVGSTVTVDYQTSHDPFTGTDNCYYFAYMDYGAASSWTTRYLTHTTSGATIPFNVYSLASTTNPSRVRLTGDASSNTHVIAGPPDVFTPSGSTVTNTNTFYAKIGTLPAVLAPGIYTESLIFRVAARLTNPLSSDWGAWPVVLSRGVQFMYQVEKELSLSIVATGGIFDPLSTAKLMSFGELESFEVRSADVIIKTNVGYRLKASSSNEGAMEHSSGASIAYVLRASGSPVNLIGSSSSPVLISSSASNSPPLGFTVPIEIEVGTVTGNEPGGEYADTLSLSIEAF